MNMNKYYKKFIKLECNCGGVKPRPMIWAQEQRFINNTPEEKKSWRTVVTDSRTRKYPRRLVREEYPPRT